jgi:serine/threonine-protein kinase
VVSRFSGFLAELKRRKVWRVAGAYGLASVAIATGVSELYQHLLLPDWTPQIIILMLVAGFPIAIILAWAFELRPEQPGVEPPKAQEPGQTLENVSPAARSAVSRESAPAHIAHPTPGPLVSAEAPPLRSKATPDFPPAIAVLPFDDFSPNPDDAYFANGIHEEILTQLQKIRGLAVRGRTSVLQYRDHPKPLPEIAHDLGVTFILEGSARKAGGQVRLTAQLIDARRDEHLWAENYDRPLTVENLIAAQSDIAQQVAQAVGVLISPEERTRIETPPTESLTAYDYYLLGRHHLHRWSLREIEQARDLLREAVQTDPDFAQGHAGLAYVYSCLAAWGQPPDETWPHVRIAAQKALEMDESQVEAHTALALEAMSHRYDWHAAREGFERALEHNPSHGDALDWLAISLCAIWGRPREAKEYSRRAHLADPLSLTIRYHVGMVHLWAGEPEAALAVLEDLGDSDSAQFMQRHGRGYVLMAQGRYEEALEAMRSAVEFVDHRLDIFTGILGYLYARVGSESEARGQLRRLDELEAKGTHVSAVSRAHIHAGLGESEAALDLLERAYGERNHFLIYLGNSPWDFEELAKEPRFQALLRKMDFPRLPSTAQSGAPTHAPSAKSDRKSIAVLPFANRSGLAEDVHFTDGIHDQIISQLFKVGSLSVRGRTSVEVYRNSPKNLRVIGEELNARYVMEGGVQRAGERVRIIVQLLDSETDEHLWAEEYDRTLSTENLFDVQSEIALGVVSGLKAVLTPIERARIRIQPTKSLEAYEAFLRGRQHLTRHSAEGTESAIAELERAIALDPGYAHAYSGLAMARIRGVGFLDVQEPAEARKELDRATEAAKKALGLDPSLSEAHVVLALRALQWDWDWDLAKEKCLRAMELNPSDALPHAYYAVYLTYKERRFAEAVEATQRATELDPHDPGVLSYRIWVLWATGKYGQVLKEAQRFLELAPESPFAHYWIGIALLWTGHPEEAIRKQETALRLGGRATYFLTLLGATHARAGNAGQAKGLIAELEQSAERGAAIGRWIATIYAALGDGDKAMQWLNRGVDDHDPGVFHAMTDPFFKDYWEDPRFLHVMSRIGLGGTQG